MNNKPFQIKPATPNDARDLAELATIASDGLTQFTWQEMREGNETVLDVGVRRARRSEGSFSYQNAKTAYSKGQVIAAIFSFPIEDTDVIVDDDEFPPFFVPLALLEQKAIGTWNVHILATYPDFRRKGAALALLCAVEASAIAAKYQRLSVIVRDVNPARNLYEEFGFYSVAKEPMVKTGVSLEGANWVLMFKDISCS